MKRFIPLLIFVLVIFGATKAYDYFFPNEDSKPTAESEKTVPPTKSSEPSEKV